MKPRILFIIDSDPRVNHRPVEAMRIAAGTSVWGKAEVLVCLRGPALQLLCGQPDELVNGEELPNLFSMLEQAGNQVYAQNSGKSSLTLAENSLRQELSDPELAALAADCNTVVHF